MKVVHSAAVNVSGDTIAVIGSGNSPHDRGWGEKIDAHDAVVRMHGQYPMRGNVVDLGRKWTVVGSNLHPISYTHIEPETTQIWCVHCIEKYGERERRVPWAFDGTLSWMPREWTEECEKKVGHWPTSGCFLLYWLYRSGILGRCDVYGIDGYRTKYYGGKEPRWKPAHDMEKERPVLDWLLGMAKSAQ